MKLIVKFNLVLVAVFLLATGAAAVIADRLLERNAREEILQNARIMMEAALAVRSYTSSQVKPLLETQMKYEFLPQSVPAFAATEYFADLRKKHPEYTYKEATLNPTNLRDRANDWEADIVNRFRNDSAQAELIGERDSQYGRSLFLAKPIQIKDPACLICHSTVDAAPKTMIDRYGPANGFGWQLKEVIGAQIISVPVEVPLTRARETFKVFLALFAGLFAFLFVALNILLYLLVVRPVKGLAEIADRVSLGDMEAPEFASGGKDEVATLAQSFDRMRKSMVQALKMLET